MALNEMTDQERRPAQRAPWRSPQVKSVPVGVCNLLACTLPLVDCGPPNHQCALPQNC
jgi:hypothetical protein